jgi:TPR repeat protein
MRGHLFALDTACGSGLIPLPDSWYFLEKTTLAFFHAGRIRRGTEIWREISSLIKGKVMCIRPAALRNVSLLLGVILGLVLTSVPCQAQSFAQFAAVLKIAEQGDADAQNSLGVMYRDGRGTPQDYRQAVDWYRKAAVQGYAKAQFNLGLMYAEGLGVEQDYSEAVIWYTKAAEQGYANAQSNLGLTYANGQGVPQDYALAVYWYNKAVAQGNAFAQSNLGLMYDKGQGVPQDYKKAVHWYSKAAEQGAAEAQANLGLMYAEGLGVPKDYKQAYAWFCLGALAGQESSAGYRDMVAGVLTPGEREEATVLVAKRQQEIEMRRKESSNQ